MTSRQRWSGAVVALLGVGLWFGGCQVAQVDGTGGSAVLVLTGFFFLIMGVGIAGQRRPAQLQRRGQGTDTGWSYAGGWSAGDEHGSGHHSSDGGSHSGGGDSGDSGGGDSGGDSGGSD